MPFQNIDVKIQPPQKESPKNLLSSLRNQGYHPLLYKSTQLKHLFLQILNPPTNLPFAQDEFTLLKLGTSIFFDTFDTALEEVAQGLGIESWKFSGSFCWRIQVGKGYTP